MTRQPVPKVARSKDIMFADALPTEFKEKIIPPTSVSALGFWLLLFGVGLLGSLTVWASVAPIQSAVVAGGTFEVEGDLQVVEHLEGGIIREILVKEGDEVEAGQVIARLDRKRMDAQANIWRGQLVSALARDARLRAEFEQADHITPSPELAELIEKFPSYQDMLDNQNELFLSNISSDLGQVTILNERIDQLREQVAGIDDRQDKLTQQLQIVQTEVADLEALFKKGLTLKSRISARREDEIILIGRIGQSESERQSALQQIAEVEERKLQIGRERRLTIANERQLAAEQIVDIRERLAATQEVLERLDIRAPIAGRLIGFSQNTVGAVIDSGQTLLEIVPRDSKFIVKARVGSGDIDEVELAGPARVRMSAYSFRKTPPVNGTVSYIAADASYDAESNQNYYDVHVALDIEQLAAMPDVKPVPGMPVQVMIATGEQTIMTYLLDPVLGGIETAMVENE